MSEKSSPIASFCIPTLYFAEGLPYTIVTMMSIVMFKNLNMDNEMIGVYTSLLSVPWTIKFLWAPLVDLYGTRRLWIVVAQTVLAALTLLLTPVLLSSHAISFALVILALIGWMSATHDIAIDGFYLDLLDRDKQALFVGVRNASYKVAWLFGSGAMVFLAGKWAQHQQNASIVPDPAYIAQGWALAFAVCAAILGLLAMLHQLLLPHPKQVRSGSAKSYDFSKVFLSFLNQPRIAVIVTYILIFRLGDALLLKMAQPFLLDTVAKGGLAITTADVGVIYGTVGLLTLLAGGLIGGWLVSTYGLKRCLLPTAIIQNLAILLYWLLAIFRPATTVVAIANGLEQFAYGFGTAAYTVFLLRVVKEEYKAAHYAMASGIMALGLLIPGMVSGYLQGMLGYREFFLVSFFCSIPGMFCIPFLPLNQAEKDQTGNEY